MQINEIKQRLNNHTTHMESLVTLGPEGLEEINDKIDKFIAGLDGGEQQLNTTTKIDGSPAVVCWSKFEDYPDNSICLKSFLTSNKNCLSSTDDIEAKYGDRPDMAEKLMYCLLLAKSIPSGEAWQGDCLYTKNDLREVEIDGTNYLTFQPNKIVYAFTDNDEGYENVANSDFGICFHTIYKGNLEIKSQSFNVDASRLNNVPDDIYVMSPALGENKREDFNEAEILNKYEALKQAEDNLLKDNAYELLCDNKVFKQYWDMFENANLSDKQVTTINIDTFFDDLVEFVNTKKKNEYDKKVAGLKTERGIENATNKYNEEINEINSLLSTNKYVIINLVKTLNLVAEIKMLMWEGYKKAKQNYSTFYNTKSRGYIPADMEGIALSDQDGNIVKVVDRSTFSHANRSDDYLSGWQREELQMSSEDDIMSESQLWISEDTIKKNNGKWVNKGEDGEHGEFKTKKEADAQRRAIFASGWHEGLDPINEFYSKDKPKIIIRAYVEPTFEEGLPSGVKGDVYDEQTEHEWEDFISDIEDLLESNSCLIVSTSDSHNEDSLSHYIDFYYIDGSGKKKSCLVDMRVSDHKQTGRGKEVRKKQVRKLDSDYKFVNVTVNNKMFASYEEALEYISNIVNGGILLEGNSLGRLFTHMNDGVNFAIIGSLDKDDITKSHWDELLDLSINNYKLLDKLERVNRRVSWKFLTGRYTMESTGETITEKSIILYNITKEVADHLAQSINQESYIWKDDDFFGFVYTDGHEENVFSRTNLDLNREHLNDFASRLVSKHAEGQDFAFSINEVMSKPGRHQVIRPGDIWEEPLFKYYSDEDKQAFYECYGE